MPTLAENSSVERLAAVMADGSDRLSYADLEYRSVRLARALRKAGLGDGDRVAILMENSLDWLVAMWAARRATLLFVPVNWHLKPGEIRYVVENSQAAAIITSPALLNAAAQAIAGNSGIKLRLTTGPSQDDFISLEAACAGLSGVPPDREPDGGPMLYSSGTTGQPKGILRPPALVPFGTPNGLETMLASLYGIDRDTVYLSPAPQYHAAPVGWTATVLLAGGTVVMMERFDAQAALDAIARWKVTHAQFVPTHFVRMLALPEPVRQAADLSSLRAAVHAAAPCAPAIKHRMIEWLGPRVFEYYSGSERCGFTCTDTAEFLAHPGSVGRSRTGKIHIVDPETRLELPAGKPGLVYFEDPVPFAFHGLPEKTAEVFSPQGWGTFGDIGYVDGEGYLTLVDRLSQMIISGGVNIYPAETEAVLGAHPAVADVAVIGVPNEEFGEEVKAVVQLHPDAEQPTAAELIAFCKARIAGYKCPRSVDFTSSLPRHPNGKLLKRELRAQYWPAAARV
jgi:acyl-CoA synthetase (AMP-forming)/AMP-acid ligase II